MNVNKWHWDYEESVTRYYHIYSIDDGSILEIDIEQSEHGDNLVQMICDLVNTLLICEAADKVSRKVKNELG